MTDVAATELIAESSEDREQGKDEVAAVSDLLHGQNECSIEMRGRNSGEQGSARSGAWERHAVDARGTASEDTHTHTHKAESGDDICRECTRKRTREEGDVPAAGPCSSRSEWA